MNYRIVQGDIQHAKVDAIILWTHGDKIVSSKQLQPDFIKHCQSVLLKTKYEGSFLETRIFSSLKFIEANEVIIIGLGEEANITPPKLRQAMAKAIKQAQNGYCNHLAVVNYPNKAVAPRIFGQVVTEGGTLGNYKFSRYRTVNRVKEEQKQIEDVAIYCDSPNLIADLQAGITHGLTTSQAIVAIRDLVNEPPGTVTPKQLANFAEAIGNNHPSINVTIHDREFLKQEGYEALLAVASGSDEPPYLIHLVYKPPMRTEKRVVMVGKGVTFDSGGLGVKPPLAMRSMKSDMSGAATVLGLFLALGYRIQADEYVPCEIHGIIPTTENMISGKAMRPDDIIQTKQGKTIEVAHTDAEGRLILADALTYAQTLRPDVILDFATLTGAAIVALGRDIAAFMGNNDRLIELVTQASKDSGEQAWQLPLPDMYKEYLKSPVADIQNIASAQHSPDAIIGGLFLQEFIDDSIPWVHLDIAGPAWREDDTDPLTTKGASGWGILLLDAFLNRFTGSR